MCALCMYTPGTFKCKRTSHPMELELQLVVSHYVSPGSLTQLLYNNNKYLPSFGISPCCSQLSSSAGLTGAPETNNFGGILGSSL